MQSTASLINMPNYKKTSSGIYFIQAYFWYLHTIKQPVKKATSEILEILEPWWLQYNARNCVSLMIKWKFIGVQTHLCIHNITHTL